jgi:hypothetical protein
MEKGVGQAVWMPVGYDGYGVGTMVEARHGVETVETVENGGETRTFGLRAVSERNFV